MYQSEQTPSTNNTRKDYTWTSPDGQYKIRLTIFFVAGDGEAVTPTKTRLGADCGSDHEIPIAKFRLKLKEVGKTTGPFRCDLNHFAYTYTVEVRNRCKGSDLTECLKNCGWKFITLYRKW